MLVLSDIDDRWGMKGGWYDVRREKYVMNVSWVSEDMQWMDKWRCEFMNEVMDGQVYTLKTKYNNIQQTYLLKCY